MPAEIKAPTNRLPAFIKPRLLKLLILCLLIKKQKNGILKEPKHNTIFYETISIPMPVYVVLQYNINIKTLYQQQMNELMQPFLTKTGAINYFIIEKDGKMSAGR
jgi:hypothetical protein